MLKNSACTDKISKLHNITSKVGLPNTLQSNDFGTLAKDLFYKSLSSEAPQIDSCFANIQADWVARDFACTDDRNGKQTCNFSRLTSGSTANEVDLSFLRMVAVQVLPYRYYQVDSHTTGEVKPESFCISTMLSSSASNLLPDSMMTGIKSGRTPHFPSFRGLHASTTR